jgi:hypothetical protein
MTRTGYLPFGIGLGRVPIHTLNLQGMAQRFLPCSDA